MRKLLLPLLLLCTVSAHAVSLADLSNRDAINGLKQALTKGAGSAVAKLGKVDGFLGNPQVKIPLPDSLQRVDKLLRMFGQGKYADEAFYFQGESLYALEKKAEAIAAYNKVVTDYPNSKRRAGQPFPAIIS